MKDGEHVRIEIIFEILTSAIDRMNFQTNGGTFLLDGFPMTLEQAAYWTKLERIPAASGVIYLECAEAVMIDRVVTRARQTKRDDVSTRVRNLHRKSIGEDTLFRVPSFKHPTCPGPEICRSSLSLTPALGLKQDLARLV